MPEQLLSLVVPVFNEQEVLDESFRRMDAAMRATGHPYEIIYVNDGSRDDTLAILRRIAAGAPQVRVLSFSRNFGHQLAVTCGMDAARGSALIIIDVDLQDPPELIPEMVRRWKAGADIVYGKRIRREGETLFKKLTASAYYRLLSWMSAYPIPLDTGDFRLLDRRVADVFCRCESTTASCAACRHGWAFPANRSNMSGRNVRRAVRSIRSRRCCALRRMASPGFR